MRVQSAHCNKEWATRREGGTRREYTLQRGKATWAHRHLCLV